MVCLSTIGVRVCLVCVVRVWLYGVFACARLCGCWRGCLRAGVLVCFVLGVVARACVWVCVWVAFWAREVCVASVVYVMWRVCVRCDLCVMCVVYARVVSGV